MKIPEKLYENNTNGKFLFIRHGQTYFNKGMSEKGLLSVKADPNLLDSELTNEGIEKGKDKSKFYEQFNIEQIYVSPLYRTLQSDIGRKSFMELGLSHFGIRQIFVSFNDEGKNPLPNHSLTATNISSPQRSQKF
jgi:hypothetical protein